MATQDQLQSEITRLQRQLDGVDTELKSAKYQASLLDRRDAKLSQQLQAAIADNDTALVSDLKQQIADVKNQNFKLVNGTIPKLEERAVTLNDSISNYQSQIKDIKQTDSAQKSQAAGQTAGDAAGGSGDKISKSEKESIKGTSSRSDEDGGTTSSAKGKAKPNNEDRGSTKTKSATTQVGTDFKVQPSENVLHQYSTYTYGITLHALSAADFNEMVKNPTAWKPNTTLISSGGRWGNFSRPAEFADDFYFNNLNIETVVGLNARSRGSNAIQLSFEIVEPYGLTLLDRIIAVAKQLGITNHTTMPYLLQVDFFGNNDNGNIVHPIPNITKYIPIQIVEFKIKVGTTGATYSVKAVPFNHQAFNQGVAATPINMEVTAHTLESFFQSTTDNNGINNQTIDDRKRLSDEAQAKRKQASDTRDPTQKKKLEDEAKALAKQANASYVVSSYNQAYNTWFKYLETKTKDIQHANQIYFSFDPDIANSKIVEAKKTNTSNTPMADRKDGKQLSNAVRAGDPKQQAATPSGGPNEQLENFTINAGTSVLEVINMIMRNSDYIKNQIIDPSQESDITALADKQNKPISWFKIVPSVELTDFDAIRNQWGLKTTFHVKKYTYYNSKHPLAPQSVPSGHVKEYNYIYTGKNNDIIDFAIDFDSLYFTAVSVTRAKMDSLSTAAGADETKIVDKLPSQRPNAVNPNQLQMVAGDQQATTGLNNIDSSKKQAAADLMKSIYTGTRGDMLNLKLKIVGDPDFIKQDDIYYSPASLSYDGNAERMPNGSLAMDRGEIFVKVSWKTPVDIDEITGGMRLDGSFATSSFSGLYKVLTVTSSFSNGKFEQTLDMVRVFDPPLGKGQSSAGAGQGTAEFAKNDPRRLDNPKVVDPKAPAPRDVASTVSAKIEKMKTGVEEQFKQLSSNAKRAVTEVTPTIDTKKLNKVVDIGDIFDIGSG